MLAIYGLSLTACQKEPTIQEFLRDYVETWSSGEIDAYADLFVPEPLIMVNGFPMEFWEEFVNIQKGYNGDGSHKETFENIRIDADDRAATVSVDYCIDGVQCGVDRFLLVRRGRDWKIAALVFYVTNGSTTPSHMYANRVC